MDKGLAIAFDLGRRWGAIENRLRAVPAQVAAEIAAATCATEVARLLQQALAPVLEDVARFERDARAMHSHP